MVGQWLWSLRNFDLRDLEPADLGAWSLGRQILVAMALVGMLLVLGYLLQLRSPIRLLEQQREMEVALKVEFENKALQVASLDARVRQAQALEAAFRVLLAQLPGHADMPGLLDDISRLGLTSGLHIEHIQWSPEVSRPVYAELPLQMSLVGAYHDLGLFVSGLASLSRIVTVQDFVLAPFGDLDNGQLRMTLQARTYRTHDQGLAP